jgi:Protein of unknown function (DUF2911)
MRTPRGAQETFPKIQKEATMFDKIRVSSLAVTLGVALLAAAAVPQLRASEFDKKTIMTFSAPVEISGHTLPAGTYVFKTLENDRNIVVVMNSEENRVYALLQTIPTETSAVPDKVRVELSERPGNAPAAIHAWFYPGDTYGWEFPSPKAEKQNIAQRTD